MADPNASIQLEEIEALEAIFGSEDFTLLSVSVPREFEILLNPVSGGGDDENHVQIKLRFKLPGGYPMEAQPEIQYFPTKNILNSQLQSIQSLVSQSVSASKEVCVFNVTEEVREWLITHNKPQLSYHEQLEVDRLEEERETERRRLIEAEEMQKALAKMPSPLGIEPGTLVTTESFLRWKALFDEEQRTLRDEKQREIAAKIAAEGGPRLTGKQLFQQNLAKELLDSEADALEEEEETEDGSAQIGVSGSARSVFWENEGLFADEDVDVDLEQELQQARREEREKASREDGEGKGESKDSSGFKQYADDDDDDEEYVPEDHFEFDDDDDGTGDDEDEEDEKKAKTSKGKDSAKMGKISSSSTAVKASQGNKSNKSVGGQKQSEKGKQIQSKGGSGKGGGGGGNKGKDGKGSKGKK